MERMLEWAVADNREASAATLPQHTENAVRLLHMVQDFLQAEGLVNPALWTEKVLEETVTLMDSLMVWYSAGDQWFQLSQLGLRLLLGFMAQEDPEVSGSLKIKRRRRNLPDLRYAIIFLDLNFFIIGTFPWYTLIQSTLLYVCDTNDISSALQF